MLIGMHVDGKESDVSVIATSKQDVLPVYLRMVEYVRY
jgi:hypothetical protein